MGVDNVFSVHRIGTLQYGEVFVFSPVLLEETRLRTGRPGTRNNSTSLLWRNPRTFPALGSIEKLTLLVNVNAAKNDLTAELAGLALERM